MTRAEVSFIRRARIGYLATADESGEPSNVPFCFAFDGATLYSPVDEKPKLEDLTRLKRIRNIRENPRVCVVVNHYDDDWAQLGHMILRGKARVLLRGLRHQESVRLLRRKYPQYRQMAIHERPIIAIQVTRYVTWGRLA
jgi:PPOX class probable F420-dependent enzyme